MAEVISLTASIITVVRTAGQVVSGCYACYKYYHTIKQAKSDIKAILDKTYTLKCVLADLHALITEDAEFQKHNSLEVASFQRLLKSCEEILKKIIDQLGITTAVDDQITVSFPRKLTWWLKRDEVKRMTATLEEYKSTFILVLGQTTFRNVLKVDEGMGEISASLKMLSVGQASLQRLGQDTVQEIASIAESVAEDIKEDGEETRQLIRSLCSCLKSSK